jgi:hypothetical protein
MMGVDSTYKISFPEGTSADFDMEVFAFDVRRAGTKEGKHFIGDDGTPSGSEGYWENMIDDMKIASLKYPGLLILVDETERYEFTEFYRHYFRDGKSVTIEQIKVWPEFTEEQLV